MSATPEITHASTHGHAAVFYDTPDEQIQLLAAYFQAGCANHELCVFVTGDDPQQVLQNFKQQGFDATEAIGTGALRIFDMAETYLPDGKFAAEFMLRNVQNFIEEAASLGYSGLRTAGEMTWLYHHAGNIPEAIRYEGDVNGLGAQNPNFTGLCLYPVQDNFQEVLGGVLHTHPTYIYDGHPRPSPYYTPT